MNTAFRSTLRVLRRLLSLGTNLLLVVSIGFAVLFMVPSFLGYERYVITGGSMSGTIEKGSVVFERRVPVDEIKVGDVITYLPPAGSGVNTLVTHRVISIEPGARGQSVIKTQGDANADADPWEFSFVDDEQPVVEHVVPVVGHLLIALADPDNRRLLIGIPAGLIALLALRDLVIALHARLTPNRGTPVEIASPADAPEFEIMDVAPQPHAREFAYADKHTV